METPEILEAFKNGVYYAPATKHYAQVGKPATASRVYCDRCTPRPTDPNSRDEPAVPPLAVCIGYRHIDLCMKCVDELSRSIDVSDNYPEYMTISDQCVPDIDMQSAK